MTASFLSRGAGQGSNAPLLWLALLFATITYAAISTRALLNPHEINYLIDMKRILSVLLGAAVLWFALRAAERYSAQRAAVQAVAILRVSALGIIALLIARELYDVIESDKFAASLALNIRFILIWIGYFAAAVAGFMGFSYYRQLQTVKALGTAKIFADSANYRSEMKKLLMVLREETGYESADIDLRPDAEARAERRAKIDRLLAKL
jgi:hypothetical protein